MTSTWQLHTNRPAPHVAEIEIDSPPNNFLSETLIEQLADRILALDDDPECRAIILCSNGRHFCAGANFSAGERKHSDIEPMTMYRHAIRIFSNRVPIVAAVQGRAVGGGAGLAFAADFRVVADDAVFAVNFARISLHHGFAISASLPFIVGTQAARRILLTGHEIRAEEALSIGLAEEVTSPELLRSAAIAYASKIADGGPLAVRAMRATLRADLVDRVKSAVETEAAAQRLLFRTDDFAEGVLATRERRPPLFLGR